jgi:hypothetical protein
VACLCEFYPGIYFTAEGKARKNLSQGKKNLSQVKKNLSQSAVYRLPKHYIYIHKTGLFALPYHFPVLYLTSDTSVLKDERALPGNIQGHIIFCFRVINVEYLTNASPPHPPPCLQFVALLGTKYFVTVCIGI